VKEEEMGTLHRQQRHYEYSFGNQPHVHVGDLSKARAALLESDRQQALDFTLHVDRLVEDHSATIRRHLDRAAVDESCSVRRRIGLWLLRVLIRQPASRSRRRLVESTRSLARV
jgi:hypothetical protein